MAWTALLLAPTTNTNAKKISYCRLLQMLFAEPGFGVADFF
jgi:hypothetical protein